jgi:hypothetical protein
MRSQSFWGYVSKPELESHIQKQRLSGCREHWKWLVNITFLAMLLPAKWMTSHDAFEWRMALCLSALVFARWMMTPLNQLNSGHTYSPEAFEQLKEFILSVYPFVARDATLKEQERIEALTSIPIYLGGLGY